MPIFKVAIGEQRFSQHQNLKNALIEKLSKCTPYVIKFYAANPAENDKNAFLIQAERRFKFQMQQS